MNTDIKRVFLLGSGSSIGHSLGLFPSINQFFSKSKFLNIDLDGNYSHLIKYVLDTFGRDIRTSAIPIDIEDLLTNLEIELERNSSPTLTATRDELLRLIQQTLIKLGSNLSSECKEYKDFIFQLNQRDTIITFNWDVLLDNLLDRKRIIQAWVDSHDIVGKNRTQYTEFILKLTAIGEGTISGISTGKPYSSWNSKTGFYLKAHGSIDWIYCANQGCRASKKVYPYLLNSQKVYYCAECHEPMQVLIVPPVLKKDYRQYPLIRRIWNLAAKELSSVDELIIWGYSLPPTDFHSRWLLRQARHAPLKKIILINPSVATAKGEVNRSFISNFTKIFYGKSEITLQLFKNFSDYINEDEVPYSPITKIVRKILPVEKK